jgi:hypothetical protein
MKGSLKADFRCTCQCRVARGPHFSTHALEKWLRKSAFHLLFVLPKSSLGSGKNAVLTPFKLKGDSNGCAVRKNMYASRVIERPMPVLTPNSAMEAPSEIVFTSNSGAYFDPPMPVSPIEPATRPLSGPCAVRPSCQCQCGKPRARANWAMLTRGV